MITESKATKLLMPPDASFQFAFYSLTSSILQYLIRYKYIHLIQASTALSNTYNFLIAC